MTQRDLSGIKVVATMTAIAEDGSPVAIIWAVFDEEPEDDATAYQILKDGRVVPCDLGKLSDWRKVAALVAAEGG